MRVIVLRERAHLGGNFRRVEADDLVDEQSVCYAVRQVMERAQLVRHGVADAQEGVGERHTGHGGGVGHLLAGDGVVGPLS